MSERTNNRRGDVMRQLVLVAALALVGCAYDYSSGERGGQVVKFSRKGIWTKSWEGQINLGGMLQGTDDKGNATAVPNVFEFSADGQQSNFPQIRAVLDSGLSSGRRVRVWYRQAVMQNPFRYDTGYLLDSAKVVQ